MPYPTLYERFCAEIYKAKSHHKSNAAFRRNLLSESELLRKLAAGYRPPLTESFPATLEAICEKHRATRQKGSAAWTRADESRKRLQ